MKPFQICLHTFILNLILVKTTKYNAQQVPVNK